MKLECGRYHSLSPRERAGVGTVSGISTRSFSDQRSDETDQGVPCLSSQNKRNVWSNETRQAQPPRAGPNPSLAEYLLGVFEHVTQASHSLGESVFHRFRDLVDTAVHGRLTHLYGRAGAR